MTDSIKITEEAAKQFRSAIEGTDSGLTNIRIVCVGVSCSGPSFQMGFDEKTEEDTEIDLNGATLLVGPETLEVLEGTTIDFVTNSLGVSGFKFSNPNQGGGCASCPASSCGSRSEDE